MSYVSGVRTGTIHFHNQKGAMNQIPPSDNIAIRAHTTSCGLSFISLPKLWLMTAAMGKIRKHSMVVTKHPKIEMRTFKHFLWCKMDAQR